MKNNGTKKQKQYLDEVKDSKNNIVDYEIENEPYLKLKKNSENKKVIYSNDLNKKLKKAEERIKQLEKLLKEKEISKEIKTIEIKNSIELEDNKYYLPICRENGCEGNLNIYIDEENFIIKCICEKNKDHQSNLFFETFERFYLKESTIKKCYNCSTNLENKDKYKCNECDKLFCSTCILLEQHIKKDIKNLRMPTNRCLKDKNELLYYCLNCKQKICAFCYKKDEEKSPHKNHEIKILLNEMPSLSQIHTLKEKIIKKSEEYNSLIKSLDEWKDMLFKKIEKLKSNLLYEIRILKKLFLNFNQDYLDYTYYSNFHFFYNNIKEYNSEYLKEFMNGKTFDEKSNSLIKLFSSKKHEIPIKNVKLKRIRNMEENGVLEILSDKYLLFFSYLHDCIKIISINNFDEINRIEFKEIVSTFNFSTNKKKIYACLSDKKSISVINYNQEKNILELSDEKIEINDGTRDNFKKCIYLNDTHLISIDSKSIYLWCRDDLNAKQYYDINQIVLKKKIIDICLINEKSLLISQKTKLKFFSIDDFIKEKVIENKNDHINEDSNLILINGCVLVNCMGGIEIISIKTKEMVTYIESKNIFSFKKLLKSFDNYIYILDSSNNLLKFNFFEYNLTLVEKIEISGKNMIEFISIPSFSKSVTIYNKKIIINGLHIIFWDDFIYRVIEIDSKSES